MTNELWTLPATRMRDLLDSGEASSRELVDSCLARIEAVNPRLNALVEVRPDEARAAAEAADSARAAGEAHGCLHGIPVATKINTEQRGYATTQGVVAWAEAVAEEDAPVIASLRNAGALLVGRTNAPAFAFRWFSNNDLHGRTLNPWDAGRTPGGSSGGSSAAVASGMLPLGHGNDIGGSVRYPAYATGTVGLRPTPGLVSGGTAAGDPPETLSVQTMAVHGPHARTVGDVRLGLHGMSGRDPRDPWQVAGNPTPAPSPNARRVGLLRDPGVVTPSPSVDAALTQAGRDLEAAGYEVEEVELPLFAEAYRIWYLLVLREFLTIMPLVREVGDEAMQRAALFYQEGSAEWWGTEPTLHDYIAGYARRGQLMRKLSTVLEEYPTLLTPVSADEVMLQDADIQSAEGMRRCMDIQWPMMSLPLLGVPGLAVPTGVVGGLPTGVQLIGRRFDDERLLDVGEVIERARGSFTPIDPT
ncbi:amidase [Janibacter terrae]|uniref:amidase n=1 Tax=Janibacter terrae TaxID=103817 RepID=UPI00082B989C|nr:amidase [Janibacter terrae]MBA4084053.1 amidase [Kytococcus sp.]HBO54935.1 amidase [Janibacter terrae]